ncbi:MAG: DUF192 domain-containing protein [Candidatus Peribacteraceae bacterium]|nr:DUF192 domain-containing protein [Candidatus Peribacteraceae bacterium]
MKAISDQWSVVSKVLMVLCSAALFSSCDGAGREYQPIVLEGPGKRIELSVEIADTPQEQERGLMFRERIGNGMLFVFDRPRILSFWMKNTLVPLDIMYFDAEGAFVSAVTMQPCTEDPCLSYPSQRAASFALEMVEGFVETAGVGSGWKLNIPLE